MKVDDAEGNEETCRDFCGSCPSYPGTEEWLFCAKGKSAKDIRKDGCLCSSCQVYLDHQLSSDYFCTEGAAE